MEGFTYVDLFATKGIEYLLVIGFLLVFTVFWRFLSRPAESVLRFATERIIPAIGQWFEVPDNVYFHPGHTWVKVENGDIATVGIDDFAQKFVGKINSIKIPPVGTDVAQGEKGIELNVDTKTIPMLSPVEGKVVAINKEIVSSPGEINKNVYGDGWLLKVYSPRISSNLKNLLTGTLAKKWIEDTKDQLTTRMDSYGLGSTMADGGLPVEGIARNLAPDNWDSLAKEFFLTSEL